MSPRIAVWVLRATIALLLGAVVLAPFGQQQHAQGTPQITPQNAPQNAPQSEDRGRSLEAAPPEAAVRDGEALPPNTPVIDIDSPERALYRIAVPALLADDSTLANQGAEVLRNDFRLISLFEVLDPRAFVANLSSEGLEMNPGAWTSVGAQGVIKGRIERVGGQIRIEMRLYEIARGNSATLTRTYNGSANDLRGYMHDFANEVVRVLTGQAGAFGSRITFARRVREGRKDVYVAGFDGAGVARISSGRGVAMLPTFGPGGIWYSVLSTTGMFITRSGQEERPIIDHANSLNMGASICGSRVFFSSTRDGNSEIYSANLDGTEVRRLTNHPGIDVSPACGGPGGLVAFVSNRHGSPQVWAMTAEGGGVRRLTFRGNYNQTPAWCPVAERRLLAFTGRSGGLDVFTVNIDTQQYMRLTQGQGVNKDPAFSPDCRMVAFYSTRGGIFLSNPEGLNQQMVIPGAAETLRWSR